MKRLLYLLFSFAFSQPLPFPLSAQADFWQKAEGPYGGYPNELIQTDSGVLYAVPARLFGILKSQNIFRSDDYGQHWSEIVFDLDSLAFLGDFSIGPGGSLYTIGYDETSFITSIYRSDDDGTTWELLKQNADITMLYEMPGGTLIGRGKNYTEVLRSTDAGQNWSVIYNSPTDIFGTMRKMPGGDFIWFCGNDQDSSLYLVSQDSGSTWSVVKVPGENRQLFISPGGILLAEGFAGYANYRSADGGQSWQAISSGFNMVLSSFTALPSGRVIAAADDQEGLFYSDDEGQTWSPMSNEFAVTLLNDFISTDGGVLGYIHDALHKSTDGGETWVFMSEGMDLAQVYQMAFVSADTMFAHTAMGLWRTDNAGQNWSLIVDQPANAAERRFAYDPAGGLVVMADTALLWSNSLGDQFFDITPPGGVKPDFVRYRASDSLIIVNTPEGAVRSLDNGQSWQLLLPAQSGTLVNLAFHPGGRIYAYIIYDSGGAFFWFSDDQGSNWTPVQGDWNTTLEINELFISQTGDIFLFVATTDGNALRRSTDNGQSWFSHPNLGLFPLLSPYPFAENASGHLFVLSNLVVSRSLDKGLTWSLLPAQGNNHYLYDPVSPDQYLYMGNRFLGLMRTKTPTTQGAYLEGFVRHDADSDCTTQDAQTPLHNWIVKAAGEQTYYASTIADGHYLMFVDTGTYEISAAVPNSVWWEICESPQTLLLDSIQGRDTVDFSAISLSDCPLITVDLGIPWLRRCFDNPIVVNYCNQGAETAIDSYVDIWLDSFTTLVSSSLPPINLGNNSWRFETGDLPPGACGNFSLVVHIDCDSTVLGQTHCITVHGWPDTLCVPVPAWSGADIRAEVDCQDTVLQLKVKNVGTSPSELLDYIIIVDDVVLTEGSQSYDPGGQQVFTQPADGRTWRIESQQEPGHPFATPTQVALAFAEGCGGFESLGFINQFAVDSYSSSWDTDCLENVGAYDPNDKQGFPIGAGPEHRIRPGQDIEYLIRFQNTGTDTAFNVVIVDSLSQWLDPASLRPGAASHPYTWQLDGQGVVKFTFANILLPDSNTNLAASQGFVSFRIGQRADVPLNTQIFNEAGIYFDFNQPVITNRTLHTVGFDESVAAGEAGAGKSESHIIVAPNPVRESAVFSRSTGTFDRHHIEISDAGGRVVHSAGISGKQYLFQRKNLPEGVYFFRISDRNGLTTGSGKFVIF